LNLTFGLFEALILGFDLLVKFLDILVDRLGTRGFERQNGLS